MSLGQLPSQHLILFGISTIAANDGGQQPLPPSRHPCRSSLTNLNRIEWPVASGRSWWTLLLGSYYCTAGLQVMSNSEKNKGIVPRYRRWPANSAIFVDR